MENMFEDICDDDISQTNNISSIKNLLSLPNTTFHQNSEENISDVVQRQWWFNMFDPINSKFNVILNKRISELFL